MTEDDLNDIDLSKLLRCYDNTPRRSLRGLFELKIKTLGISQTKALEAMQIESRALNSILDGSSSRIDMISLIKLSKFLGISQSEAATLFLEMLNQSESDKIEVLEKRSFILENFDINELKQEKIIKTTKDFDHIESAINQIFNYDSIFDYRRNTVIPAFSSSKLHKNNRMCDYWIEYAREIFIKIHNTNTYNRKALIEFFPKIRWYTMNVKKGIWDVIRELYKMGITVIYLPKFKKLHIRGATFVIDNRPCIVLTDYKGFYPTLWFSLLHELHHVLFDWEELLIGSFHLSDNSESTDIYTKVEIEDVANNFAREYLFPESKMSDLSPHLNNRSFVKEYASRNHVHESIPYLFSAYDKGNWGWIRRFMPDIKDCLDRVSQISFSMSASEVADFNLNTIYSHERA